MSVLHSVATSVALLLRPSGHLCPIAVSTNVQFGSKSWDTSDQTGVTEEHDRRGHGMMVSNMRSRLVCKDGERAIQVQDRGTAK